MKMIIKSKNSLSSGLSVVEVLLVVATIGAIAAFALPRVGGIKDTAEEVKLRSDVAHLNSAVKVFIANGGNISTTSTAEDVIARVGRSVSADQADTFVGFTGSMVDNQLVVNWLPTGKRSSGKPRAVWDSARKRFEITENSVDGISSFRVSTEEEEGESAEEQDSDGSLDGEMAEEADDGRTSSMQYASKTNWVWDYEEVAATAPEGPTEIPLASIPGNTTPPAVATPVNPPSGPAKLQPPIFSVLPGSYPLADFMLSLTLSNPNVVGSSVIYVQRPGQSWAEYTEGSEIIVTPDEEIRAFAAPLDSTRYETSNLAGGTYDATTLQLALQIVSNSATVNYWDITDSDTGVNLKVPNIQSVPDYLKQPGLFSTYYTTNGADPRNSGQALRSGTYDESYNQDTVNLDPSLWGSGETLELKAFAKSSVEDLVRSSSLTTTSVRAQSLQLEAPAISMVEQDAGAQMVSLELQGRYPPGTQVFYNTSGDPPYFDEATGRVVNGTAYVGPFVLQPNLESDDSGSSVGNVDVGIGKNDVTITNVTLKSKGKLISQDESYYFDNLDNPGFDGNRDNEVVDSSNDKIELSSISIQQGDRTIVADNVNVLEVGVSNFNYPDGVNSSDVTVKRDGRVVADLGDLDVFTGTGNGQNGENKLGVEIAKTLSSTNLRDYVDYAGGSSGRLEQSDHDFDVSFAPLTNKDFLVVMERFGNSTFDLRALDANGEVISGSDRLTFRAYSWNTGHAPSDQGGQAMFFSVIDIDKFNVDTNLNSISGFRVNNDGGADFKFFTISDDSFEDREVRYTGSVQAVAIPPESLAMWFDSSQVASREVEGTTTVTDTP